MTPQTNRFISAWWAPLLLLGLLLVAGRNPAVKEFKTPSGAEVALLPGGWFVMGDKEGEADEKPPHKVWVDSHRRASCPCGVLAAFSAPECRGVLPAGVS